MSATQTRLPRAQAVELAWELEALLSPYCERIEILGSIRRGRPDCGDIELLAIAKTDENVQKDLFGNLVAPPLDLLHIHVDVHQGGLMQKRLDDQGRQKWGTRYKAGLYKGFPVDLYVCKPPAQWGVLKVLRTGSAEFNKRLVVPVERGGWMPKHMYIADGQLRHWTAAEVVTTATPDEEALFAAIGRDFVPPELREV